MEKRFSLFKFIVGVALLYYGLKTLHLIPNDAINFVESLIGGVLGNLWGLILLFVGIIILFGSIYSRSYPGINTRYYRNRRPFSNDDEEEKS